MDQMTDKLSLKKLISVIREYGYRMLEGLSSDDLLWKPSETKGRTMQSYFRHIINAEIYWLKCMDDDLYNYVSNDVTFTQMLKIYKELGNYLSQKVEDSSKEELILEKPVFENEKLIKKGTLSWMIWRTSFHAIHHYAQIAYVRYCLEKPPKPLSSQSKSWGEVMDSIIFLGLRKNINHK